MAARVFRLHGRVRDSRTFSTNKWHSGEFESMAATLLRGEELKCLWHYELRRLTRPMFTQKRSKE